VRERNELLLHDTTTARAAISTKKRAVLPFIKDKTAHNIICSVMQKFYITQSP
jgi:hypothetical protein